MRQTLGAVFEAIAQENVAGVACVVRRSEAIRVKSDQPSGPSYIIVHASLSRPSAGRGLEFDGLPGVV